MMRFGKSEAGRLFAAGRWPARQLGRATVAVGTRRVALLLPAGFRALPWREPGDTAAILSLAVVPGGEGHARELILSACGDETELSGPSFRACWRGGRGVLRLPAWRDVPLAATFTALHAATAAVHAVLNVAAGGVLLHGAVLVRDGSAFVVTGPSGAGKSTLAARFADHAWSEEYAWLEPDGDGRWWARWYGERRGAFVEPARCVWPLAGVYLLGRGERRSARTPLTPAEAVAALLPHATVIPGLIDATLGNLARLAHAAPCGRFAHALAEAPAAAWQTLTAPHGVIR
jgi:hypothetical protein